MNYLRYSSEEMFSSTELIRKSKNIFDKLNKKEIEKAIILRDGKPGFMLLDFTTYEKIMKEYEELKSVKVEVQDEHYMSLDEIEIIDNSKKLTQTNKIEAQEVTQINEIELSQINDEELQKALQEIENINLDEDVDYTKNTQEEDFEINLHNPSQKNNLTKQPLKEFWD